LSASFDVCFQKCRFNEKKFCFEMIAFCAQGFFASFSLAFCLW